MDQSDLKKIIDSARNDNEFPFDRFFEDTFQKLLSKLKFLTKSEENAKEVFVISMQKFWERFVINQEELPLSSVGYIYMMCRNTWLLRKRKPWNAVTLSEESEVFRNDEENEHDPTKESEIKEEMNEDLLRHRALSIAMNLLSSKCKLLMEAELDNTIRLKDLQEELGFGNYQALVQAKYNCKKRLVQKVYEALNTLKNNTKNNDGSRRRY